VDSSVRVNLTVPQEVDELLAELHQLTGRAKAAYALEALTWYLPRLQNLRVELVRSMAGIEAARPAAAPAQPPEGPLTRQQRRKLDRDSRKGR
jgi:hypothetical protein